ncbi:hypothetical protein CPB86DRAFT_785700 [Serendipita vermifera]|nr:hypothetical protein CPB86DRAFT_785700 [Serendipita vermifera]
MLSNFIFGVLLSTIAASASPLVQRGCGATSYGPFKLYAKTQDSSESSLVRLVRMGTNSLGNPISTMTVCTECGVSPAYWQLKDSVLTAVLFDTVDGQSTVNLPLTQGKINFVTEDNGSLTDSPIYCGVANSSGSKGLPALLSVDGDADHFSICSFIGTPGPVHRQDIYFNQTPNRIAYNCRSAMLVMQSTGIIPEPISG